MVMMAGAAIIAKKAKARSNSWTILLLSWVWRWSSFTGNGRKTLSIRAQVRIDCEAVQVASISNHPPHCEWRK
jgi:hypothetical protein